MNLTVTGRHMEMTDALKSYVEGGLGKISTHFNRVIDADVVLSVEKHRHIAEINLHANGIRIHGQETSSDMYASVDAVLAKLDRQIKKYKDRINRHQPRTTREARIYQHEIIEMLPEVESEVEAGEMHHRIITREKLPTEAMSVDEAAMQLELVNDNFLVFFNAETQQMNVIYSREDGTYGVIEPQV